jgi:ATP-dependent RNA helicase DeaD
MGAIVNEAGIAPGDVGAIDIGDGFSLVEVPSAAADEVIGALQATTLRGERPMVRHDRDAGGERPGRTFDRPEGRFDRGAERGPPRGQERGFERPRRDAGFEERPARESGGYPRRDFGERGDSRGGRPAGRGFGGRDERPARGGFGGRDRPDDRGGRGGPGGRRGRGRD